MSDVSSILEDMKNENYRSALVDYSGHLFRSNFQFDDSIPSLIASVLNVSDAMLRQVKTQGREYELQLSDSILVAIPVSKYYLISFIENRETKKKIREYAKKIGMVL